MFFYKVVFLCVLQQHFIMEVFCSEHKKITLSTEIGTFTGKTDVVSFDGKNKPVQRFLGIPYAKPPVGVRRFARPEPFGTFSDVYDATYHRPLCLQVVNPGRHLADFVKSEDCLYLNIYVPGKTISKNNKLAVMLYIHGGGFATGGADIYSGDILSTFNDVIVVTINYRLNVFGFLNNGAKSSGNFGLWDMRMAIQWVHDHINEFGGDPMRVTLFGNSAGGASVMYQAIFPQNKGLFQRIIAQSGSVLAFWSIQKSPADVFAKYIKDTNCDLSDYNQIIECLRGKPATQLQTGTSDAFIPSVDRDFLHTDPSCLLSEDSLEGKTVQEFFASIDVIVGVTSSDGAVRVPEWDQTLKAKQIDIKTGVPRSYFEKEFVPDTLRTLFGKTSQELTEAVIRQYTDVSRPNDELIIRRSMVDIASDTGFFLPETTAVQKHSDIVVKGRNSKSFFFVFDQKPSFAPYPDWLKGATHTMEVAYVFGLHKSLKGKFADDKGGDVSKITQGEINLSTQMMTLWSNFAKSGNPNAPVTATSFDWPPYDTKEQKYLNIAVHMTSESVKHHLAAKRMAFWQELGPGLQRCNAGQITSGAPYVSGQITSVIVMLHLYKLFQ